MIGRWRARVFWRGLLGLALLPLLPWSCQQRRPQAMTPAVAPPPNYLEIGNNHFDEGDFSEAADAFSVYLILSPDGQDRDKALFRLALTHAFPSSPVYDAPQAVAELRELLSTFPASPMCPEAQLLLDLNDEADRLRNEQDRLRAEIQDREQRIAALGQQLQNVQNAELDKLRADVSEREERIRELTAQLDRLKEIDMQRRPSTVKP